MKCAVAIVLALVGMAAGSPLEAFPVGLPPVGLRIAAPVLVTSPAGVGFGYNYGVVHDRPLGHVHIGAVRVASTPLSFGLPAVNSWH